MPSISRRHDWKSLGNIVVALGILHPINLVQAHSWSPHHQTDCMCFCVCHPQRFPTKQEIYSANKFILLRGWYICKLWQHTHTQTHKQMHEHFDGRVQWGTTISPFGIHSPESTPSLGSRNLIQDKSTTRSAVLGSLWIGRETIAENFMRRL